MKKFLITLSFILSFVPFSLAQAPPPLNQNYSFTTTGTTTSIDVSTRGLNYFRIQWANRGVALPSACTIALQTSNNNVTWSTGISGTCTTNGTSSVTQISTNYIRLNLSAYTAAGNPSELLIAVVGYYDSIANITAVVTGGGGGDASAANQVTGNASLNSIDSRLTTLNTLVSTPTGALAAASSNATVEASDSALSVAASAINTKLAGTAVIATITNPVTVTDGAGALNVIVDSGASTVTGPTAIGATYAGNPINIACKGVSAEQTAVTNGQEVNCISDLMGKVIFLPYANPENFVQGVTGAITDTTSTSVIASAGGSLRNYITHCTISNSHATVGTFVKILDGATIIDEVYAAAVGGGASLTYPVPLKGTAATAINAQPVTTGANVIVSCNGYKGL